MKDQVKSFGYQRMTVVVGFSKGTYKAVLKSGHKKEKKRFENDE